MARKDSKNDKDDKGDKKDKKEKQQIPLYERGNPAVHTDGDGKNYYPGVLMVLEETDKEPDDAEAFRRGLLFKLVFFDLKDEPARFPTRDRAEQWMDEHGVIMISLDNMEKMRRGEKVKVEP
jgi:hypothetical protein